MTIYNDLRLKAMVGKVSEEYRFSYNDKVLAYISMFDNEPKKYHNQIKNYIYEFEPNIWRDFILEDTKKTMTNIIENYDNGDKSSEETSSIEELMKKLK